MNYKTHATETIGNMAQLDLFGQPIDATPPGKKSGGVGRNTKAKKHRDVNAQGSIDERPTDIYINSDGNILRFIGESGGVHTYEYIQSNTKIGKKVTFTTTALNEFLHSNRLMQRQEFVKVNDL